MICGFLFMKTCTKCKVEKEFSEFGIVKTGSDKLRCYCKKCSSELIKIYREENPEKIDKSRKKYRIENADKIKERDKINCKKYRLKNKEKIKEKKRKHYLNNSEKIKNKSSEYSLNNRDKINKNIENKKLTNPLFKLRINISKLICVSIKGNGYTKKSKTYQILGCSFEDFKTHLENQFTEGMTWENHGIWHMDHIYPVSRAIDEEHLIKLNHYTNFQPLWAIDNIKKGNKIQ